MPLYTLTQLRYFCAVAETGSFAAAAAREHLSATAIAAAVSELEDVFGMALCSRRRSRGVELNSSGQLLYQEAIGLLRSSEELAAVVRGTGTELSGTVRVGCFPGLGPVVLPQLMDRMKKLHPKVSIDLVVAPLKTLITDAEAGRLDCLITYTDLLTGDFVRRELYPATVYALVSKDHRFAKRKQVTIEDLKPEPMILYESWVREETSLPMFGRHPLEFQIAFRTTQDELARAMVAHGQGFSLTIQRSGSTVGPHPGCALIEVATGWAPDTVAVCWLADVRTSPRMRELVRLLEELAEAEEIGYR